MGRKFKKSIKKRVKHFKSKTLRKTPSIAVLLSKGRGRI